MDRSEITAGIEYVRACLDDISEANPDGIESDETQAAWDEGVAYVRSEGARLDQYDRREAERAEVQRIADAHPNAAVSGDGADFNINTRTSSEIFEVFRSNTYVPPAEFRSRAVTAVEESRFFLSDDAREGATRTLERVGHEGRVGEQILVTLAPEYRTAYFRHMSGDLGGISDAERGLMNRADQILRETGFWNPVNESEARALALTNVTGKLVPAHLDPTVVLTNDGTANPFRQISRVEQVNTNVWTGVSSAGVTAGWTGAEGTEVGDDTPSFSNPAVTCYMADAFVPLSFQAYEDWFGGESELERLIMDAKDRLEGTAFATGSGTNQPIGIVTALDANTNVEIASTTADTFGLVDVYNVQKALPPRYRRNGRPSWVMNIDILNRIRQFGTSNNYHGFTVDLTAEGIPAILGNAVYESSDMDDFDATGTESIIVYGDFSNYLIADRIGLVTEFVPNLFGASGRPTGQRGWLSHWRTGADSINDSGFRLLQT